MTSERECSYAIRDSNVVVSAVGSKVYFKKEKDFEDAKPPAGGINTLQGSRSQKKTRGGGKGAVGGIGQG